MPERTVRFRRCLNCAEDVYTYVIHRQGVTEVRCNYCGFPIDVRVPRTLGAEPVECAAVLERDPRVRNFLAAMLERRGLAREVATAEDGEAFLELATSRLAARQPLGLAILGTATAHLDPPATALALRAVEKGLRRPVPVPIVFLYPSWADDPLRGTISLCQPALYLSREVHPEEANLEERLARAVTTMLGPAGPREPQTIPAR